MSIAYSIPEFPPTSFEYDATAPTKRTEELSVYLHYILNDLATQGAKIYIETETPETLKSASDSYQAEFSAWINGIVESVGAYLSAPEESRALPVLASAPVLPVAIASSVMLPPALLLKTGVETVATIMRSIHEAQAIARQYDLNRVLDKSLNSESFWGGGKPYLAEIRDILDCAVNSDNTAELGLIKALRILTDKQGVDRVLKVLTHIVLDKGLSVEDVETYFPEMKAE